MKRYWYKFRVKYGKAFDTGKNKKVSEEYLVDAESFTETEKRATKAATESPASYFSDAICRIWSFLANTALARVLRGSAP